MPNRVCDFCGTESSTENMPVDASGHITLDPNAPPYVLLLTMRVDPGVKVGDFQVKESTYTVCTNCILTFLKERAL